MIFISGRIFVYRGDDLGGLRHVPNVDAETKDLRFARQQRLRDVERAQVDVKLRDDGARWSSPRLRQIAQSERGVMNFALSVVRTMSGIAFN